MLKKVWVILAVGGVAAMLFNNKKRSKMNDNTTIVNKAFGEGVATVRDPEVLTAADRRELTERFKGMSDAEIKVWMELVPVEYCITRIQNELNRAAELKKSINALMDDLK